MKAIVAMPLPDDKRALLRFLNVVKYQGKFIPGESHITAPLRALLKEDAVWCWQPEHTAAVNQLKGILSSKPVLKFYDVKKPITLQSDASQHGLGACLLQEGQVVAYASRALVGPELHYAQLEKELLAVVFATNKFHQYIYGKEVDAQTDHKPLEVIMKKLIGNATARVQRMMLKLQRYTINLVYVPGKHLHVADALSHAYIDDEADCGFIDDIEVMVHRVTQNFPESSERLEQIRSATADDATLQRLYQVVMNGWPALRRSVPEDVRPYWNMRDEISMSAKSWGIKVTTSSPTYAQSNGQAERAVQTLKSLLQKADAEGRDPYIAMLEHRNTPISGLCYAPAQLAMSRLLRSKLPTSRSVLQPRVVNAKPDLQERMKRDYDRGATSLKPLTSGDVVRVQRKSGWEPAVVQYTHESPRSYVVRHEGGELRRNRRHLRRTR